MKVARKVQPRRRVTRRAVPLSLTMRIERLEKAVLFPAPASIASSGPRFVNLGADSKPTSGDHIAVFDRETKLVWAAAPLQDGRELTHADAMKACSDLDLMGFKDWRAPTIRELLSIVDYDRCDPAIDPAHFKGPYSWTWSSTLARTPAGFAWGVGLGVGYSGGSDQGGHYLVRAVRSGQQLGRRARGGANQ